MSGAEAGHRLILRATTASARLRVIAEDRADITVNGDPEAPEGSTVTVSTSSRSLEVRVPAGTELVLGTASGRVEVRGPVGPAKVATESGRVGVEAAERIDIRTTSGRVEVGTCRGTCRIQSVSGRVTVGVAGGLDIHTTSGRVSVDDARGEIRIRTTSGRVSVGLAGAAEVDAETVSGRINVLVDGGLGAALVEGTEGRRVDFDARPGDDCVIRCRAVSGRIQVRER